MAVLKHLYDSAVMAGPGATPDTSDGAPGTFWALVAAGATRWSDHVLLADDHGRTLTGAGLHAAAESAAAGLAALGIGAGTRASWQLPTTIEAMIVTAALARLGAVQNPIIPVLRERDVAFIVGQVGSEFLLVPEEWRGVDHGAMARAVAAEHKTTVVICDHASAPAPGVWRLPAGDPAALPPAPSADDLRWCYYSSGTTAVPKGVRHTDASVMAGANGVVDGLSCRPDDVYPIAIPVTHIGGMAMLTASLRTGLRLVLFEGFDPATTPERMAAHRPTFLGSAVPFFLAYLAAQERHGADPLFPALRLGVAGGAPLPSEVNRAARDHLGIAGICNSWGLTEFPVATSATPDDTLDQLEQTVGLPTTGVTVRAVAADGSVCAPGVEGELRLRGPQCFRGYVDPALDADGFDAEGWFRTGDLGTVEADGRVRVTGRLKEVIIRNAENVSALEVEDVLLGCPGVADVAVIGVPDPRTVERVCAVVVTTPGTELTLADVVAYCKGVGMTPFKIPERLEVVDAIPRNGMGKILKVDLRARFG